jgi:hypothetical protein
MVFLPLRTGGDRASALLTRPNQLSSPADPSRPETHLSAAWTSLKQKPCNKKSGHESHFFACRRMGRLALFRLRIAARKPTTFVKNDLSDFALVHAYISDALFKIRTSSIACT